MLDKLWDDIVAGPQPERGLEKLRKLTTNVKVDEGGSSQLTRNTSLPTTPTTPATPTTPQSARKVDNVWRSVFNPGSNSATGELVLMFLTNHSLTPLLSMIGCTVGTQGATIVEVVVNTTGLHM